jgi:hypothetical protein
MLESLALESMQFPTGPLLMCLVVVLIGIGLFFGDKRE